MSDSNKDEETDEVEQALAEAAQVIQTPPRISPETPIMLPKPPKVQPVPPSESPKPPKVSPVPPSDPQVSPEPDPIIVAPRPGFRMGIVGGRATGKSYLFQGMVWRVTSAANSGALAPFLGIGTGKMDITVNKILGMPDSGWVPKDSSEIQDDYRNWRRLSNTKVETQFWYRMHLEFPTGWWGYTPVDVDFLDASGEELTGPLPPPACNATRYQHLETLDTRRQAWAPLALSHVMVFCLPMWAAFPSSIDFDKNKIEECLKDFAKVVQNFKQVRKERGITSPVKVVLALTMADDPRVSLETLKGHWIEPWLGEAAWELLKQVRTGGGAARYLDNARQISDIVTKEMLDRYDEPLVSRIPGFLNFGHGQPFVVPLSAIEGGTLKAIDDGGEPPPDPPQPAHVELPLLVALCHATNALI